MKHIRSSWTLFALVAGALVVGRSFSGLAGTAFVPVTPTYGGLVGGSTIVVDNRAGDQWDPRVSGNLAVYTDGSDFQDVIRYHDFLNPISPNPSIPPSTPDDVDRLSDVNGDNISFSRFNSFTGSHTFVVFNVATLTTTEIGLGVTVGVTALGGDTLAFSSGNEILVGRISNPSGPLTNLSASASSDHSPAVSPAGSLVVWSSCLTFSECSVMKSIFSGGVWSAPVMVKNAPSFNPDTDGTNIVYEADGDIYVQPVGGGAADQLVIDGVQRNPSIADGVIAFETSVDATTTHDLFVYQIATNTLFRVTDTPLIDESLNDVTVLPNGDVRVVWAADDASGSFTRNIYARTFALPLPPTFYNFTGFFQPVDNLPALNIATAGSSLPVKFSLGGDQGLGIVAAGYPVSSPIPCDAGEPGIVIDETVTAGNSSLSYNAASGLYTYVWKTDRAWKGTCRMFALKLADGGLHFAKFSFK